MKTQDLKKQLDSLIKFLDKKEFEELEIIEWICNCVSLFTLLKVNGNIISGFIKTFKHVEIMRSAYGYIKDTEIGPFHRLEHKEKYLFGDDGLSWRNPQKETLYITLAFSTAENIIKNREDTERLIPKSLVTFFKEKPEYSQIYSSLQTMEQNFENRDAEGLAANSISLLGSIFNLEKSLASKDLSKQISNIKADKKLLEKFGVRSEVLTALDNSRILRNHLTSHKTIPIEYDVPFAVSLGTAYLVIMFLQITMSTGELIK